MRKSKCPWVLSEMDFKGRFPPPREVTFLCWRYLTLGKGSNLSSNQKGGKTVMNVQVSEIKGLFKRSNTNMAKQPSHPCDKSEKNWLDSLR